MDGSENRIAERRDIAGLKQIELAERLSWSRGQLANIESGNRKVDLPELREIARVLTAANPSAPCTVVDLLLPEDAPGMPDEAEAAILNELRAEPRYDARTILAAVRGVIAACRSVMEAQEAPKALLGDSGLVRGLSDRWNTMNDSGRQKALGLLDAARDFGR